MCGIAHSYHPETVLFCLIDSHLHGLLTHDVPHTVITVENRRGGCFLDYINLSNRVQYSPVDPVYIDRLEPSDSMGIYAAFIPIRLIHRIQSRHPLRARRFLRGQSFMKLLHYLKINPFTIFILILICHAILLL